MPKIGEQPTGYKEKFWVKPELKIAFPNVPRTASTSLCYCFDILTSIVDYKDVNKDYTTFAVYRNPFDRFISGYLELLKRPDPHNTSRDFWNIEDDKEKFYAFVREAKEESFDVHITSQFHFLTDKNGKLFNVDYWLSFENLNQDFDRMCDKLGIAADLPKINMSRPGSTMLVMSWINENEEINKIIFDILEKDWELYNNIALKN